MSSPDIDGNKLIMDTMLSAQRNEELGIDLVVVPVLAIKTLGLVLTRLTEEGEKLATAVRSVVDVAEYYDGYEEQYHTVDDETFSAMIVALANYDTVMEGPTDGEETQDPTG